MDPSSTSSVSAGPRVVSSSAVSSSTTTKATNSVASPLSISQSHATGATAVPTTVITSVKSAILPYPPYGHSNGNEQCSKDNPNLASLLSGRSDHSPPPPQQTPQTGPGGAPSLQSILLAKDSPPPEYHAAPPSSSATSNTVHTSGVQSLPLPQHQSQHHFPLSDKCHSFFLSAGLQPPASTYPCPPSQPPPAQSKHANCMIYKGYKKLCNAQSIFKCTNKSSTSASSHHQEQPPPFNPNLPFGSPSLSEAHQQQLSTAPTSSSSSTQPSCILGDLLRGGKQSRKKNYTSTSETSLMDTANDERAMSIASQNGASITAGVFAATMGDEVPEPASAAAAAANNNNCNFNMSYYSQLLKKRIKKLYHDSDSIGGTDSQDYMRQHPTPPPPPSAPEDMPFPIPRSMSDAALLPTNHNRKSVISKLGAYPQIQLQQARAMICSRMSELGYKLPYCNLVASTSAEAAQSSSAAHQSVNSYLDSLIRSNVIREPSPPSAGSGSESASPPSSSTVVTTLSNSVITAAADINPNKPHHFVNLIDKIISNVFIATTVAAATTTSNSTQSAPSPCFLAPSPSGFAPQSSATQSGHSSLASVLSSSNGFSDSSPPHSTSMASPQAATPQRPESGPSPAPSPSSVILGPPPTPPRPPSNVSAITQLLNSDQSPPSSPASSCQSYQERPSPRPSPKPSSSTKSSTSSQPMDCLSDISDKVYQQLIEFEFNHESILKKFQTNPNSDSMSCHTSSNRPGLNPNEKARIEELEHVLYPLQFCLSSMCEHRAAIKKNLHKSFFAKNPNVSVDFQRQTLLATTEQAINLLIELTKQLDSFSELSSADQMNLLRTSVMEIMLMRSILILPQRMKEKMSSLKRCLDDHSVGEASATSSTSSSAGKLLSALHLKSSKEDSSSNSVTSDSSNNNKESDESSIPTKEDMEPCTSHPHDRPFAELASLDHRRLEELMNSDEIGSESSRDSFGDELPGSGQPGADNMAADYAKQFRAHYIKLARSIDKDWYEDRTIFYLLFAILLFRPTKSNIGDVEKVREEHLTYVYLLKRYLENKFKSYCTARSHFIRIFDRLEELQKMNDQVIQKLLDFDLVCAQNLLEKLCIC